MIYALDYGVYKADKLSLEKFIETTKGIGHEVVFVYEGSANDVEAALVRADARALDIGTFWANGDQKAKFIRVDVWIDAKPESIPTAADLAIAFNACKPHAHDVH